MQFSTFFERTKKKYPNSLKVKMMSVDLSLNISLENILFTYSNHGTKCYFAATLKSAETSLTFRNLEFKIVAR